LEDALRVVRYTLLLLLFVHSTDWLLRLHVHLFDLDLTVASFARHCALLPLVVECFKSLLTGHLPLFGLVSSLDNVMVQACVGVVLIRLCFLGPALRKLVIFAIIGLLGQITTVPVLLLSNFVGVIFFSGFLDERLLEVVLRRFQLCLVS